MPAKHALLVLAGMWWIACAPRGFHNHLVMEPALPGSFITGWCGNLRRAHVIHGRSRKQLLGTYFAYREAPQISRCLCPHCRAAASTAATLDNACAHQSHASRVPSNGDSQVQAPPPQATNAINFMLPSSP